MAEARRPERLSRFVAASQFLWQPSNPQIFPRSPQRKKRKTRASKKNVNNNIENHLQFLS